MEAGPAGQMPPWQALQTQKVKMSVPATETLMELLGEGEGALISIILS